MALKLWHYFCISSILMFMMVVYACYTREQFYPIVLLLVTSKVSIVLLSNMVFTLALLLGQFGIKLFFGQLRDAELELIYDRSKYSITETCLALTIFRNELSPSVFAFFLLLLFVKIFHWLSRCRLDHLEQVATVSIVTHTALLLILVILIAVDALVCYYCVSYSITKGKTVIVLFAFEFGVLILTSINNFVRYAINVVDGWTENGLHYKGLYFMILDLICDGLKFCTYVMFFCLVFVYYGLPIHIVRDIWMAFAAFYQRLVSLIRYLRLTNKLEERLEDATEAELAEAQECLICREGMERGKKLPCKHVFHLDCLRMWLQHQQACPLCRSDIPVTRRNVGQNNTGAAEDREEGEEARAESAAREEDGALEDTLPHPTGIENRAEDATRPVTRNSPPFSADLLKKSIPGFFIVLPHPLDEGLKVVRSPGEVGPDHVLRTLLKDTVVFVNEYTSLSEFVEGHGMQSILWLHIPDGWVPMEQISSEGAGLIPLLRPYLPPYSVGTPAAPVSLPTAASSMKDKTTLRRSSSSRQQSPQPSAAPSQTAGSHSLRHTPERSVNTGASSGSTNAALSDAITRARDDISQLTRDIRRASSEHSRTSTRRGTTSSAQTSRSTSRVEKLVAMQQQIDALSSSIADISDSLSAVRAGLISALTDELSLQDESDTHSSPSPHRPPSLPRTPQRSLSGSREGFPPSDYTPPRTKYSSGIAESRNSPAASKKSISPQSAQHSLLDSSSEGNEKIHAGDSAAIQTSDQKPSEAPPLSPGSNSDIRQLREMYFNNTTTKVKAHTDSHPAQSNDNGSEKEMTSDSLK